MDKFSINERSHTADYCMVDKDVNIKTIHQTSRQPSAQSYYSAYKAKDNKGDNKGRFERPEVFRSGFSRYEMTTGEVTVGSLSKWTAPNCSGFPMDYDRNTNCVYMDGSDGHCLLIGATGSKKSRLIVMPTVRLLAASGEAMIICDPKGEIYRRTADYLEKHGYDIRAIDLRDPEKGDGWNILSVPYSLYLDGNIDKACEFINDITANLIPITSNDPFWDYSARDMLFGLALLLFKICKEKQQPADLVNMRSLLKLRSELFSSTSSMRISNSPLWQYAKEDELIRARLQGTVVCPSDTMACIISVFDQHMTSFSLQPKMVSLLSHSSFDLHDIGFGKNAVFLIMPDEKTIYHQIVAIFIKQMYELLIDNAYKNTREYRFPTRVNFLLDEFTSLPKMTDMPQMITASRSRNIRFMLVIQSKHQLKQRYAEEAETIMSNCSNWLFLTSRETELLREISELSGVTGSNREPLISVSRLQHLDKDSGECLVFSGRKYPYFAYLPDIEEYDGNNYALRSLPLRKMPELPESAYTKEHFFQELVAPEQREPLPDSPEWRIAQERHLQKISALNDNGAKIPSDLNVDDLIARIDKKIAELEAEEKEEKTDKEANIEHPTEEAQE